MTVKRPEFDQAAIDALLNIISDGIWFWHADSGYVYRSPGWYKMLGHKTDALDNTVFTWESVIHPDDYQRVMEHFEHYIGGLIDSYDIEYRCRTQADEALWIRDTGLIISRDNDGKVLKMLGAHQNIDAAKRLAALTENNNHSLKNIIDARTAELHALNKKLAQKVEEAERHATTDYLTSLSNRFSFEKQLESEVARAERFNEPLSLAILDLDNFKQINDRNGHPVGDKVLSAVGNVLRQGLRQIDIASRWGGDEFALLLPNTSLEHALSVTEKLRTAITEQSVQLAVEITASFGVVELSSDESPIDFIRRADNALYDSKNAGRNRVSAGY